MTIRINNLSIGLDDDIKLLKKKASKKLRISVDEIKNFKIVRESIDARNKDNIKLTYAIELEHKDEEKLVNRVHDNDVRIDNSKYEPDVEPGNEILNHRPIVVGLGPAGLFAALMLAQKGYKPLVIERGEDVDKRTETVDKFWKTGELNLESNVQFGEGGAGSFSDGKLTTRIKDKVDMAISGLSDIFEVIDGFVIPKSYDHINVHMASSRKIDYISPLELAEGIILIAKSNIPMSKDELIMDSVKAFGFNPDTILCISS